MFCLDIFDQLFGFYYNNYFSRPHCFLVNSPIYSEPIRPRGIIVNYGKSEDDDDDNDNAVKVDEEDENEDAEVNSNGTGDDYVDTDNDDDDHDYHAYDQENVQYTAKIGFPPVSFAGFI